MRAGYASALYFWLREGVLLMPRIIGEAKLWY